MSRRGGSWSGSSRPSGPRGSRMRGRARGPRRYVTGGPSKFLQLDGILTCFVFCLVGPLVVVHVRLAARSRLFSLAHRLTSLQPIRPDDHKASLRPPGPIVRVQHPCQLHPRRCRPGQGRWRQGCLVGRRGWGVYRWWKGGGCNRIRECGGKRGRVCIVRDGLGGEQAIVALVHNQ